MADDPLLPDSPLSPDDLKRLFHAATEQSFRYSGAGSFYSSYQTILSRVDRYGYNPILPNHEVAGLTFITRPKLNLATPSLRGDRILAQLDTLDTLSWAFAIRCLLDTDFATRPDIAPLARWCPFMNDEAPFILPLTNCLTSISGWPDFNLDVATTEPGYFSEDQTIATGSDMMVRSYDLSLTFRDIQGGFIFALLLYWVRWIALVTRGFVVPYNEDIAARRLSYTCSIYRFVLDPSRRFITKWWKATGCFPKSVPVGAAANIGERENYLASTAQYAIPFQANTVEAMDPIIFQEFNTLMTRFAPHLRTPKNLIVAGNSAENNFVGLPYIDVQGQLNELKFLCRPEELVDPMAPIMRELRERVAAYRRPADPTAPRLPEARDA